MVELYTSYLALSILVIIWSIDIYSLVYKMSATVHKVESIARLRFESVHLVITVIRGLMQCLATCFFRSRSQSSRTSYANNFF